MLGTYKTRKHKYIAMGCFGNQRSTFTMELVFHTLAPFMAADVEVSVNRLFHYIFLYTIV